MGVDISDPSRLDSKVSDIFSKMECDTSGALSKEQFALACTNDRHIRKLLVPATTTKWKFVLFLLKRRARRGKIERSSWNFTRQKAPVTFSDIRLANNRKRILLSTISRRRSRPFDWKFARLSIRENSVLCDLHRADRKSPKNAQNQFERVREPFSTRTSIIFFISFFSMKPFRSISEKGKSPSRQSAEAIRSNTRTVHRKSPFEFLLWILLSGDRNSDEKFAEV